MLSLIAMTSLQLSHVINTSLNNVGMVTILSCFCILQVINFCQLKKLKDEFLNPRVAKEWAQLKPADYQKKIAQLNEIRRFSRVKLDETSVHQKFSLILGKLFLGSASDCTSALNSDTFRCIISTCEVTEIDRYTNQTVLLSNFKTKGITWHYVGDKVYDSGSDQVWENLLTNCSKNTSQINQWFETVFSAIDEAVLKDVPTLVHCRLGVARSAGLLVAYLVNRYGVTPEQASCFLKAKRPQASPNFMDRLQEYAEALNQ